jgi:hypothetical protein
MLHCNKPYVGMYDIDNNTIQSLVSVPMGKWHVVFDPVTATIAMMKEDDFEGDDEPIASNTLGCRRVQIRDFCFPSADFSLRHLMVYYAKMVAQKNQDTTVCTLPQYSTIIQETDDYLKQW